MSLNFKTTEEIKVPEKIVNQVIGQDNAVNIIKKAAKQRRHCILIGTPGTGKSMLGQALAELLPKSELKDILCLPNPKDEDSPVIRSVDSGKGNSIIEKNKGKATSLFKSRQIILMIIAIFALMIPWWLRPEIGDIMAAASLIAGMMFIGAFALSMGLQMKNTKFAKPKLLVDNSKCKRAPFIDATGAHAGALLGDVKHDPLQCFSLEEVEVLRNGSLQNSKISEEVNKILSNNDLIREKGYEAAFSKGKKALSIVGELSGTVAPVRVLSANKRKSSNKLIKITTETGKEIAVTPEHKVAVERNGKKRYVEAQKLKSTDKVFCKSNVLLNKWDIIKTYSNKDIVSAKNYYKFLEIKKENPNWGYKRIAKKLNICAGQTRWWNNKKHKPKPVRVVEFLERKGLLPLKINNKKLPLIARVIGASFGDGGIFANLNGIFLSSSEKKAVLEFGKDLEAIFGEEISKNSLVREGGEYGHSWHLLNTNRNIVRFFVSLGAPLGTKTKVNFKLPTWINFDKKLKDEFFGSLFGSEIGIPKIHREKNRLDNFSFGIVVPKKLKENREIFLNSIINYLEEKGITSKIYVSQHKKEKDKLLMRVMISIKFDNVLKFMNRIKIKYCDYKPKKLVKTIEEFKQIKSDKYSELLNRGYGAEHAMKTLNLTPESLYYVLDGGASYAFN